MDNVCGAPISSCTDCTSIFAIQGAPFSGDNSGNACYASSYVDQQVKVAGYVSAVLSNGFYLQETTISRQYSGIFVYTNSAPSETIATGTALTLEGTVSEYYGLTQLSDISNVVITGTGFTFIPATVSTGTLGTGCNAEGEAYEGVLVTVKDVTISGEPNQYGEIAIDDGSGTTQLEDEILETDAHLQSLLGSQLDGNVLASVTGVVRFSFGNFEIHPRTNVDVVVRPNIYQINYNHQGDIQSACHSSFHDGLTVTVNGYVSAVAYNGFYMQDSPTSALWTGIWVYTDSGSAFLNDRAVGDYVEVRAEVVEYYGLTELFEPTKVDLISTGHTIIPLQATTGAIGTECNLSGEGHEGILVKLSGLEIQSEPNQYGEIVINDGSGATQLEDGLIAADSHLAGALGSPLTGKSIFSVIGVVRYSFGSFEVHPRTVDDIVISASANSASCGEGTVLSTSTNKCIIECPEEGGRRLDQLPAGAPGGGLEANIISTYMATLPAAKQQELLGHLQALDQLFGQPALA